MNEITAEAVQFFYDNAGWCHHPDRETAEQGRQRGAEALARAEVRRKTEAAWVTWEQDDMPFDDDVHESDEYGYVATLRQYNYITDGPMILECLVAVDAEPGHPYRRVVEAELALEMWPE